MCEPSLWNSQVGSKLRQFVERTLYNGKLELLWALERRIQIPDCAPAGLEIPRSLSWFWNFRETPPQKDTHTHTHTHTHSQKALARGDWIRLTSLRRELLNSVLCEGIAEGKGISEENSWMSSQWRIGVSLEICFCRGEYRKLGEIST
jgi:hypothetical protein